MVRISPTAGAGLPSRPAQRCARRVRLALPLLPLLSTRLAAAILYWDTNGNVAGAGAVPTGNWSTSGGTN